MATASETMPISALNWVMLIHNGFSPWNLILNPLKGERGSRGLVFIMSISVFPDGAPGDSSSVDLPRA